MQETHPASGNGPSEAYATLPSLTVKASVSPLGKDAVFFRFSKRPDSSKGSHFLLWGEDPGSLFFPVEGFYSSEKDLDHLPLMPIALL